MCNGVHQKICVTGFNKKNIVVLRFSNVEGNISSVKLPSSSYGPASNLKYHKSKAYVACI